MKPGTTERKNAVAFRMLGWSGLIAAVATAGFWAGRHHESKAFQAKTCAPEGPNPVVDSPTLPLPLVVSVPEAAVVSLLPTPTAFVSASVSFPPTASPPTQAAAATESRDRAGGVRLSEPRNAVATVPSSQVATLPRTLAAPKRVPATAAAADLAVPSRPAGQETGIPIPRVRNGSLLEMLGMKTGDQLIRVNGFDVRTPEQALQAYAVLQRADRLVVEIRRGDRLVELVYRII